MFTKAYVKDLLERSLATAAQTALALLSADGLDLMSFDWRGFGTAVGVAFILSILKSLAASRVGSEKDASLVK